MRKVAIVVGALAVVVVVLGVGLVALSISVEDDMFGGGPTSAVFVDRAVGTVDPKTLHLSGDLLLSSRHGMGLAVRPLADLQKEPVVVLRAISVESISPDGRYVVAWTGSRFQLVRLSDLRAVAEFQGGTPLFIDPDRVLVLFAGKGCSRHDARILDLRERTQRTVKLSGEKAGLHAVAMDGGAIVAQRHVRGDSGCAGAGFARVDPASGTISTVATTGVVSAVADGHVWVNDVDETKVFDRSGQLLASSSPRRTAEPVGGGVVYAEYPFHLRGGGIPADPPTPLRLAGHAGPRPQDPAGDQLLEPEEIVAVQHGGEVLVAHRGKDLPNGGHATVLSRCSVPALRCAEILDVTEDLPRVLGIVGADVFTG